MQDFDQQDRQLTALFSRVAEPQLDAGFSERVMGRIHRRRLTRQLALGLAMLGGLLVTSFLWNGAVLVTALDAFANWVPAFGGVDSVAVTLILGTTLVSGTMAALLAD